MVNVNKLKGIIVERNTTQETVADSIGINRSTFYRKMKNEGNFSIKEAKLIAQHVPLTFDEAIEIFWGDFVAKTQQDKKELQEV